MNKRIFLFSILVLVLVCTPVFIYLQTKPKVGRVLGSSINTFYSKKTIDAIRPPKRKESVKDPLIYADYVALIDDESKYPLFLKQADASVPIASMTKVMTALVSLDIYKLSDVLKVSKEAAEITGSTIDLQKDEEMTVENLLYGLLMNSGNDAAETLATSKLSKDEFVKLMNEKAVEIGMKNTNYKDPAGLDDGGRSAAFDMAILFSYAIKNENFRTFVSTAEKEITSKDQTIVHKLKNSNRLTTQEIPFDGVIGGKTGFTPEAGHALVCAAQQNGRTLVGVVIKTRSSANSASAEEMSKLLGWGFESFDFFGN